MAAVPCYFILAASLVERELYGVWGISDEIRRSFTSLLDSFRFGQHVSYVYLYVEFEEEEPPAITHAYRASGTRLSSKRADMPFGQKISEFFLQRHRGYVAFAMMRRHFLILVPIYFENENEYKRVLEQMANSHYIEDNNANISFFVDDGFVVIDLIDKPKRPGFLKKAKVLLDEISQKGAAIARSVESVSISPLTGDLEIRIRR